MSFFCKSKQESGSPPHSLPHHNHIHRYMELLSKSISKTKGVILTLPFRVHAIIYSAQSFIWHLSLKLKNKANQRWNHSSDSMPMNMQKKGDRQRRMQLVWKTGQFKFQLVLIKCIT